MKSRLTDFQIAETEALVARIHPLLAGRAPEVQGAILADLMATYIAGHHPELREEILTLTIGLVRELISMNVPANVPPEWRPQ